MQPTDWPIPERFEGRERDAIAALLRHPGTTMVEIAGEERPFLIGRRTYRLADERGIDDERALAWDAEGLDAKEALDRYATFLFLGCLAFEPDLEVDDIADLVSYSDLGANVEASTRAMRRALQDAALVAEAMGEEAAGASGGKPRGASRAPSSTRASSRSSGSAPSATATPSTS